MCTIRIASYAYCPYCAVWYSSVCIRQAVAGRRARLLTGGGRLGAWTCRDRDVPSHVSTPRRYTAVSYPIPRVRRIRRARGRAGPSRFCARAAPGYFVLLLPGDATCTGGGGWTDARRPDAGRGTARARRTRTRYGAIADPAVVRSYKIIELDRWIVKCNIAAERANAAEPQGSTHHTVPQ